jgi:hypothetical protein
VVYRWGCPCRSPTSALLLAPAGLALARGGSDLWLFHAVGILLSPLALTWLRGSPYLYERYFLLGASFALILLADGLSRLWCRRGVARLGAAALALFAAGSFVQTAWLLRVGRGGDGALLELVASEREERRIDYGVDHLLRIPTVLGSTRAALPSRSCADASRAGPRLVLHQPGGSPRASRCRSTWRAIAIVASRVQPRRSGWTQLLYRLRGGARAMSRSRIAASRAGLVALAMRLIGMDACSGRRPRLSIRTRCAGSCASITSWIAAPYPYRDARDVPRDPALRGSVLHWTLPMDGVILALDPLAARCIGSAPLRRAPPGGAAARRPLRWRCSCWRRAGSELAARSARRCSTRSRIRRSRPPHSATATIRLCNTCVSSSR